MKFVQHCLAVPYCVSRWESFLTVTYESVLILTILHHIVPGTGKEKPCKEGMVTGETKHSMTSLSSLCTVLEITVKMWKHFCAALTEECCC